MYTERESALPSFEVSVSNVEVPVAAERLKNIAPGASPGFGLALNSAPEGRKTRRRSFAPFGAERLRTKFPGLAPEATFLSRSAAAQRT